jgi:hypothetical protein
VSPILDFLAAGHDIEYILEQYPNSSGRIFWPVLPM